MKKILASAVLALMMLLGAVASDTPPASAGDICEGLCGEVYDPCADPNAHHWKICGEGSLDTIDNHDAARAADSGGRDYGEAPGTGGGKGDDPRHHWKNAIIN